MTSDWRQLGAAAGRALAEGRAADAARLFGELVTLAPHHADSWYNLGYARRAARDYSGALEAYGRALALGIHQPEAVRVNRAHILSEYLASDADAEHELIAALEVAPSFVPAWLNLGQLHEDLGRKEAAAEAYRRALAADQLCARAHARLAALDPDPARAAASLEVARSHLQFSGEDSAEIDFALGNALDLAGRYDDAFAAIERANARMASLRPAGRRYDPQAQERMVDALIAAFPSAIPSLHPAHCKPVFVVGMFRSGSTVAEQLLARHTQITPGGELEVIPAFVAERLQPYPTAIADLDRAALEALRSEYLATLSELFPGAPHVTDKRPDNFMHIGLIKTLFPGATIVHTVRDPLDIAVSTYFLNFAESVSYSERLSDIGHYLGQYKRLMAHWERVFEADILRVDYERLVEDPQVALRPVYLSLGLNPADIETSAAERAIRTPSAWQARSALHSRSVGRWRNYEKHLAPLRASLER